MYVTYIQTVLSYLVKESLFGGQIWQSGAFMIIYTGICEILLGLLNYIIREKYWLNRNSNR